MQDTLVHIDDCQPTKYSEYDGYDQSSILPSPSREQNNNQGAELVHQMLKDNFGLLTSILRHSRFQAFATAIDTLFPNGSDEPQFQRLMAKRSVK